jgi:hypothetical protein
MCSFQSLEIKPTTVGYDEALTLSKQTNKQVVVFLDCPVIQFVDSKKTVIVHLDKVPKHEHWQQYKDGGVLVGEWQNNSFNVVKYIAKNQVNEQILLTRQEIQYIPQSYQGCTSCQQMLLNKLRR